MFNSSQWFSKTVAGGSLGTGDDAIGDPAHPGIITLITSYDSTSSNTLLFSRPTDGWQIMHYPNGLAWDLRWIVKPYWVDSGYTFEAGLSEPSGTNFLKIAANIGSSPNWQGVSVNAGVASTVDLGAPVASAWAKLRLRSDGSRVYFSVNGGNEKTVCPAGCDLTATAGFGATTQVWPYAAVKNLIPYNHFFGIDFFAMQIWGINR
jgi:hypothetical protein